MLGFSGGHGLELPCRPRDLRGPLLQRDPEALRHQAEAERMEVMATRGGWLSDQLDVLPPGHSGRRECPVPFPRRRVWLKRSLGPTDFRPYQ